MNTARLMILAKPTKPPPALMDWFRGGEKGGIFLPHFTKYAFQDASMTIPAVVGMPVLKMVCPVTGVVATFANTTLQQDSSGLKYLQPNGTSGYGQTASIDFTGTDKMTVVCGLRKISDAAVAMVMEFGAGGVDGSFFLTAPSGTPSPRFRFSSKGTAATQYSADEDATAYNAPVSAVLTGKTDIAGQSVQLRTNGVVSQTTSAPLLAGTFSNNPVNFFARNAGSLWFGGRFYGAVICGAARTAGQIADVERIMGRYSGVNL